MACASARWAFQPKRNAEREAASSLSGNAILCSWTTMASAGGASHRGVEQFVMVEEAGIVRPKEKKSGTNKKAKLSDKTAAASSSSGGGPSGSTSGTVQQAREAARGRLASRDDQSGKEPSIEAAAASISVLPMAECRSLHTGRPVASERPRSLLGPRPRRTAIPHSRCSRL